VSPALHVPDAATPDDVFDAVEAWVDSRGMSMYPAQEEAVLELLSGSNVVLATPTGSGKSLVATAAIAGALARGECAVYTAPIKALVSEKFFDLCEVFGADDVGMLTGDASVNADQERRVYLCHPNCLGHLFWRGKTIFAIRFTHGRNGFANGTCA
jgi:superfamily II RNA helicase